MFKYSFPQFIKYIAPAYTWWAKTKNKSLYFTFDDGPHPEITPWVLNELAKFNAKASFFCVGENVKKHPETYQMLLENGHAVGNHSYNHLNGWETENERYFENIEKAATLIKSNYFRPPYGKIKPSQAKCLQNKYELIMWSHLSRDYDPSLNIQESLKALKKAGPGAIFVFHDSEKSLCNLKQLLPELLQFYHNKGYVFRSLDQRK